MAIDIIVTAKEWRDKIYGNSYFSAQIESTKDSKVYRLPYQYGYGDQFKHEAIKFLRENNLIFQGRVWAFSDLPIKFIKIPNCKKREVIEFGGEYA